MMDENTLPGLAPEKKKKKHSILKYVIYISVVLIATGLSLFFSLFGQFDSVVGALASANWVWLLVIVGIIAISYCIDGLIILIFCRLFTRAYRFHQGLAVALIGTFYNDITPSASGGQVMQAYTIKRQGIEISNAASILVMWFILYQISLIGFGVIALVVEWNTMINLPALTIPSIQINNSPLSLPVIPLVFIGFGLNVLVIVLLFSMSYSHSFHNFILHFIVGFLGKIHLIKDPDKTRESLRVQVENFKIELRRLSANVPVAVLIVVLMVVNLILRFSIPYFAGLALDAYGQNTPVSMDMFWQATFLSSFHQMVTGLIPLPGSAGVSELFFANMFSGFYQATYEGTAQLRTASNNISAALIIWRTSTFHIMLLISGLVAAFYRSRPQEKITVANHATFVDLELVTFEERKRTSDTMYETSQLSRKAIQRRLAAGQPAWRGVTSKTKPLIDPDIKPAATPAPSLPLDSIVGSEKPIAPLSSGKPLVKEKQSPKPFKDKGGDEWGTIDIGGDDK